ncbi:MAG: prepilin-type N-terminal cleavage/methylation domain-containing protein, partial [Candidatus Bathyarchaeia archaeon]
FGSSGTNKFCLRNKGNLYLGRVRILSEKSSPGFTLIELLVVIVIIGILAAVALPLYKGYTVIAKLSEVENAMSTVASGVTAYRQDQNSWPDCPSRNEVINSLGVSLGAISRISRYLFQMLMA